MTVSKMQITWTIGRVQIIAGRYEPRDPRDRLEINARVLMLARLIRAGEISRCSLYANRVRDFLPFYRICRCVISIFRSFRDEGEFPCESLGCRFQLA